MMCVTCCLHILYNILTFLSRLRIRRGSCAREEGRVKEGELAEATWERNIFVESTTVFSRA